MATVEIKPVKTLKTRIKEIWYIPITMVLLVIATRIIDIYAYGKESLRLDESQSIWQVSHSLGGTLKAVANDVHVPLYHIMLHYWIIFFGASTDSVRFPSFVFFALSLPFVYLIARNLLSRKWSLFTVILFAFSPFMNWYANEARMYTLLALMVLINQYFFIRIMKGKKNSWLWYGISSVIGAYSHYFFFFNLATEALFFLLNMKRFPPKTLRKLIVVASCVAVAIAPWLYYFISQGSASDTKPLIALPTAIDFFNAYSQFFFGFQDDYINTILISFWPLAVVVAFFLVRRHIKANFPTRFVIFAAFVPVVAAFAVSFIVSPFFLSRYMIAVVAPLCVLITWFISLHSKKGAIIGASVFLVLTGLLFYQQASSPLTPVKEEYKDVAQYITQKATPNDIVAMTSPFTVYPFEYYYKGTSQIRTLPNWDRSNPGPVPPFDAKTLPTQVAALEKGHTDIYLIASYDQGYEKNILVYFRDHFKLVSKKTYSPDLYLYVYQVGYGDPVYYTH